LANIAEKARGEPTADEERHAGDDLSDGDRLVIDRRDLKVPDETGLMPRAKGQIFGSERQHAVANLFEEFFVDAPAGFDVAEVRFM